MEKSESDEEKTEKVGFSKFFPFFPRIVENAMEKTNLIIACVGIHADILQEQMSQSIFLPPSFLPSLLTLSYYRAIDIIHLISHSRDSDFLNVSEKNEPNDICSKDRR